MTEHVKTGGNAFPSKVTIPDGQFDPFSGKTAQGNQEYIQMGMTMRDWFAGKLMREMAWKSSDIDACAKACYGIADAMLRAREGVK